MPGFRVGVKVGQLPPQRLGIRGCRALDRTGVWDLRKALALSLTSNWVSPYEVRRLPICKTRVITPTLNDSYKSSRAWHFAGTPYMLPLTIMFHVGPKTVLQGH